MLKDNYTTRWWREKQWRWRFQGNLGSLRLCESNMQIVRKRFSRDKQIETLTLKIEHELEELRGMMHEHRDDWKDEGALNAWF